MGTLVRSEDYSRLVDLCREIARHRNCDYIGAFEPVGLILQRSISFGPSSNHYKDSTPLNVAPFAGTGGDGVHFSLLEDGGAVTNSSPVVMTVPMNFGGERNFILGSDLHEFLNLGCHCGYYGLEQFAYNFDDTVEMVETGRADEPEWAEDKLVQVLLIRLREELGLSPWKSVGQRLDKLKDRFYHKLRLPSPSAGH